jgi:DNA-binding response OmpR family regulator
MDLAEAFERAGFDVVTCASAAATRTAIATQAFALVLLDVLLPDGDGIELLAEIRANKTSAGTPIMLLSTEAEVRDRIRGLSRGAEDYVGKPYEIHYVIARARELIRRRTVNGGDDRTRVLLIDDSPTFREALRKLLDEAGYRAITAESGEEGLRVAADVRPHAIFVDGMLPGLDGRAVIRRVRLDTALRRTPCILLTGSDDESGEIRALDAGADAFVRKEEDTSVILARLSAVLRFSVTETTSFESSSLGPKKILAVDDSKTYLQELANVLRGEGYEVVCASSGEDALDLLAVEPVNCILLDWMMPGIGGKETCRRIKTAPQIRDTPLIIHTAVETRETMLEALGIGADDYIAKSSDFHVLKARIVAQIRRHQYEDESRRTREQLLRTEIEAAEARAARAIAETRAQLLDELRRKNEELEAFSYSVSHDLRAPLRTVDAFSRAALDEYGDRLDDKGRNYLERVRNGAKRMNGLIEDLLALSRVTRGELRRTSVDLGALARSTIDRLKHADPRRAVEVIIGSELVVSGDNGLLGIVLDNLLGNAWKFTSNRKDARIEFDKDGDVFFVRDNGAGFDPAYSAKLFQVFQRLHSASEFEGTGIGLATVHRILDRHHGRVWAEGERGLGATFYFKLGKTT